MSKFFYFKTPHNYIIISLSNNNTTFFSFSLVFIYSFISLVAVLYFDAYPEFIRIFFYFPR